MLSILALFTGLSMYQVTQKKFNLCAVVICNCFISLVNLVLIKMPFCYRGGINAPALHLATSLNGRFKIEDSIF